MEGKLYIYSFILVSRGSLCIHRFLLHYLSCSQVYLSLYHGKDSFGDNYETKLTGKEFHVAFGPLGQLEGEMMDIIIDNWKSDPMRNHVFASSQRVLLPSYFLMVMIMTNLCFSLIYMLCGEKSFLIMHMFLIGLCF